MKALTVEIYIQNLLVVCDEMLKTLQNARLDSTEIDRWKQVIESYRKKPFNFVVYDDSNKYM